MTAAMDVFTASGAGDEALVARLLEDGADCNLGDTWTGAEDGSPVILTLMLVLSGWTPLHAAAEAGHHGVVRLLLEAGAEVGLVTRDTGYSSLHLAASGVASLAVTKSCTALGRRTRGLLLPAGGGRGAAGPGHRGRAVRGAAALRRGQGVHGDHRNSAEGRGG